MQQVQTQKKANTRKTLYPFWFVIILGVLLTKHYHDIAVPTQNHDKEERTFAPPNHHSRKDLQKDVDDSDPLPDKDQQSLTVLGKSPFDKQQQQEAAQVNDSLLNKDKDKTKASGALSVHEVEQRFRDWLEENSKSTEIVPSDVIDDKGDIVVWIAKVISKMDIMESLLDVVEVTLRPISNNRRVSVYWKFFCFEEEAQRLIEAGLRNLKVGEGRTQVIFEPKKMKPYFWSRYLSPNSIPELVDYVWLLDGDISLRHMAWECFWTISHDQLKAKIFQPPLLFLDPAAEKSKTGWRQVVHQSSCQTNPASTMGSLVAIETGFIENQLPVFQRYAWELVYNSFGKKVRGWGNFGTSWGHDLVWCGIVERGLLKLSGNKLLANNQNYNDWRDSESTCKVKEDLPFIVPGYDSDQTLADRPVTCAIIHATPVVHLDTKAESDSKKGSLGHADGEAFRKAFPDAFYFQNCSSYDETYWFKVKDGGKIWLDRGQFRYWRSFTTDEEPCQSCKSHECIADLLLVDK